MSKKTDHRRPWSKAVFRRPKNQALAEQLLDEAVRLRLCPLCSFSLKFDLCEAWVPIHPCPEPPPFEGAKLVSTASLEVHCIKCGWAPQGSPLVECRWRRGDG